jgi:hypothetical protein
VTWLDCSAGGNEGKTGRAWIGRAGAAGSGHLTRLQHSAIIILGSPAIPANFPLKAGEPIFGDEYFSKFIKPEAVHEFVKTVQETAVEAVVAFNKEVFNLVSEDQVGRCVERLMELA